MAKKLIFDYTFDASAQTVTIDGHISLKKLLFINNATRGTTIYALGDASLRTTARTYSSSADTTTFTLNFDTSTAGHADTDDLQIFLDEEGAEFKPTETFVDPVSKLRISAPNTLIDTDFEYGLQSTKWETLERINEVPSFYSQSGDVPVSNVTEVNSVNGSRIVTVKTASDHGLVTNIPIDIRGLDEQSAEGTFIIKSVPDEKSFTYETNAPLIVTADISTVYTNLIIGRYYVGSVIKLGEYSAITTDEAAQSTLTIKTPYKSNYSIGTSFYVTNSIASRRKEFDGRALTFNIKSAPSGGAVDFQETISEITTDYMLDWEPNGVDVRLYTIIAQNNVSSINYSTDVISYYDSDGNLADHDLVTGDMIIMDFVDGGVSGLNERGDTGTDSSGTTGGNGIYYVHRVTDETFKLCSTPDLAASGTGVDITGSSTSGTQLQFKRFGRGYASTTINPFHYNIIEVGDTNDAAYGRRQRYFRPESIDTSNDTITIPNHQFKNGQPVGLCIGPEPNTTITGSNLANSTTSQVYLFYVQVVDTNKVKLWQNMGSRPSSSVGPYDASGLSNVQDFTGQGTCYTWGAPFSLWPGIKLAYSRAYADLGQTWAQSGSQRNRIMCEFETVNLLEGDKIVFYCNGTLNMGINESETNWNYTTDTQYQNDVYYVRYPAVNTFSNGKTTFEFSVSRTPNGPILDLSTSDKNNEETFVFKIEEIETANTFYLPSHGFDLTEEGYPRYYLQYRADANNSTGNHPIGNLNHNYWYWMYPVNNDHVRLSEASSSGNQSQQDVWSYNPTQENWPSANSILQKDASANLRGFTDYGNSNTRTNFRTRFIAQNHYNPFRNTFYIPDHGFTEGQSVRYYSNGNPTIQPLQNGETYYIKKASTDRFSLSNTYDGTELNITQASSTSTPNHYFEDSSVKGSVDGSYTISAQNADGLRYSLSTSSQIYGKKVTFKPQSSLNQKNGHFYQVNHGFSTGTALTYSIQNGTNDTAVAIGQNPQPAGGSPYNYLTAGDTYYAVRISKNFFALATSEANARAGVIIKEYYNYGNTIFQDATHSFTSGSIFGQIQGSGRITYTTKDVVFDGSSTSSINTNRDRLIISSHGFRTGDFVEYNAYGDATPIQGLEFGRKYYIRYEGSNEFELYNTISDAWRRYRPIDILGVGSGSTHIFRISRNTIRGSKFRGIWDSETTYFAGDIVRQQTAPQKYWIAVSDNLGNYDNLIQDSPGNGNENNLNQNPETGTNQWPATTTHWKELDEPGLSQTSGAELNTNFTYQYTPGENIIIDDERRIGYSSTWNHETYTSHNSVSGTTLTFAHDHGFETGDCIFYRNKGYYDSIEDGITTNLPTDYSGLKDGSFYYVNVQTRTTVTLHDTLDHSRQGINAISMSNAGGNTSYYDRHKWWTFESRTVDADIVSITDPNEMTINDPFEPTVIEFDPQETSPVEIVDTTEDVIYLPGYADKLLTGTRVIYSYPNDQDTIGGFSQGWNMFVAAIGNDYYRFFGNGNNTYTYRYYAYGRREDQDIDISSKGTGNKHFFTIMSENYNNDDYIVPTKLYMKPSSYSLHRPFDGGVEINPGTSADSSIVRQTRRYFRYQSGKGLQYSTATNFNAPIEVKSLTGAGNLATVVTRKPHNLAASDAITMEDVTVSSGTNHYNSESLTVNTVIDDFTFTYQMAGVPTDTAPGGFPTLNKNGWTNGVIRAGMFDDQNGFFYEYDGTYLYAVRRSSTFQCAGTVNVTNDSQVVSGVGTTFTKQLSVDDMIVIRGQSYKITDIPSNTQLIISRPYVGITATRITATKTVDTKVRQSDWNLDRCDGTGQSGYELNLRRLQMCYIDYSWYGGGKIRFGFKDQYGNVFYCHSFIHNNEFTEAYFRSGNLPARYEAKCFGDKTATIKYAPSLFHWGASVIMDGQFEDDKAYLFSASSPTIFMLNQKVDGDPEQASREYPILTVRLAPSVDAGLTGDLGTRDLINRMQLQLKQVSVSLSDGGTTAGATNVNRYDTNSQRKSATVRLILNADLAKPFYTKQNAPSLSQVIYHNPSTAQEFNLLDDRYNNGIVLYEFRVGADETVEQELGEVVNLGNSILGGDYTFPNGPDTLTVVVVPDGEYTSTSYQYTNCNARITWTESQA